MKLLVVFHSKHGYVKRYVDIIGNELGCDAVPAEKLRGEMLGAYDKILYIGSLHDEQIVGLKKFAEYYDIVFRKLVVCGVGVTPFKQYMPARIKETSVSVTYEKFIPVFYAQGGFDVDELSRTEKMSIAMKQRQIQMQSIINDDDTYFLNAMKTPVDEVKKENIQPLLDFLDGKKVKDELYSPAEITDEEQIKKYFEELDVRSKSTDEKKKELKKKLKK